MCSNNRSTALREGVQPDGNKGIQPNQSLDISRPPEGGSGVTPAPINGHPISRSSTSNQNSAQ